jgi:DNA uptake protein ComE-like DNA-binding protein
MRTQASIAASSRGQRSSPVGSVLIIVMWIAFGLVSLALYFGHSMLFEFRAAEQGVAGVQAELAIEGAARYVSFMLTNMTNFATPAQLPATNYYHFSGVSVGEGAFWVIGRGDPLAGRTVPVYGLVDEGSKLNLNTATYAMLAALPNMTNGAYDVAAAIIDWRDSDENITAGGAESETYQLRNPPYTSKNAPFESIEELRLVNGVTLNLLYGGDANLNGIQDPGEDNGMLALPLGVNTGGMLSGILDYVTVWSRQSSTRSDGTARVNVNEGTRTNLTTLLDQLLGQSREAQIMSQIGSTTNFSSLLQFYIRSGMTQQEFDQVAESLTVTNAAYVDGLVNVNTASAVVLNCLPGIGPDKGQDLVNYRQGKATNDLYSVAWVTQVLDQTTAIQAGPYITTFTYQYSADIVGVGNHGRGYRRTWFVFDMSEGTPKIIYRRDRGRLGWALGAETRLPLTLGKAY